MSEKSDTDGLVEENKNITSINRRSFVKAVGASSIAVGSIGSQVATAEQASDADRQQALRSASVQSILDELDDPELGEAESQVKELGDSKLELVTISSEFGKIIYAEVNGKESGQFHFEEGLSDSVASELPDKYQELPSGSNPVLLGRKNNVVFRRSATAQELEVINQVADIHDDAMVATGSDIDGFLITEIDEEGSTQTLDLIIDKEFDSTTDELGVDVKVDQDDVTLMPRISTQDQSCGAALGDCLAGGVTCAACSATCAGAPTGIGAVACAACLNGVCVGITGVECAQAFGVCLD